jgi:rubredoxin-NAD+ reductase
VAKDTEGSWTLSGEGSDIKGLFHSPNGQLLGFALTGAAVKERMALTKELPPILD